MTLAELIERAKRLPEHSSLRQELMLDLLALHDAVGWVESTPCVPGCISAIIGLTINHLHVRLISCEERIGDRRAEPA